MRLDVLVPKVDAYGWAPPQLDGVRHAGVGRGVAQGSE